MPIRTRTPLLITAIALLAACGGDEFASSEPADAGAGSAGSSGAAGKAGAAGQAGSSGHAGSSGKAGATGQGGALPEGGVPDVVVTDSALPDAAGGSGGATPEAGPDVAVLGPQCVGTGFTFTPNPPTAPAFTVVYADPSPLVCIRFAVECANGVASVVGTAVNTTCPPAKYCWAANVSNCSGGQGNVTFYKDADNPGDPTCHGLFPGSAGTVVASCSFHLAKTDG